MTDAFFMATKKALNNITSVYDTVWPIAVGLWNLRYMVNQVKMEYPNITEAELASKFSQGSGIHGVNYKRAFFEQTWEQQQAEFAWILLNSTIPVFEGWLEELKQDYFPDMRIKDLQFPIKVQAEISRLKNSYSTVMSNSFYSTYQGKRDRCYSRIDALLSCYRVFKEARNCYMHNGSRADIKLINAYKSYIPFAIPQMLDVSEVPKFPAPNLNNEIKISLRGVVGFSYILIKIIVTLDSELLCTTNAENEFMSRYKMKHKEFRTLKADINAARGQVKQYVRQCGFPTPKAVDDLMSFLLNNHLVNPARQQHNG